MYMYMCMEWNKARYYTKINWELHGNDCCVVGTINVNFFDAYLTGEEEIH